MMRSLMLCSVGKVNWIFCKPCGMVPTGNVLFSNDVLPQKAWWYGLGIGIWNLVLVQM